MGKDKTLPQPMEEQKKKFEIVAKLYAEYRHKRKKTIFDKSLSAQEKFGEFLSKVARYLEKKETILSQKDIKKLDCIDIANVANPDDIYMDDDKQEMLNGNWYLAIPPLKQGVLKKSHEKKIVFGVGDVIDENKSYRLALSEYEKVYGVWIVNTIMTVRVEITDKGIINNEMEMIPLPTIIETTIKEMDGLNEDERLFGETVMIPYSRYLMAKPYIRTHATELLSDFVTEITYVNIQLLNERPKAKRVKRNPHKAIASDEIETNPRPQIIRNMSSGIVIKSRAVPKAPTEESVRRYKLAAWNTRGHVRHYKTGKTVYIKPSVHHRKCLKDKGIEVVPQTIIEIT